MKAVAMNELSDALTLAVSRDSGAHGIKMISLHGNAPPGVVPGN
jgi:hypothetical protein